MNITPTYFKRNIRRCSRQCSSIEKRRRTLTQEHRKKIALGHLGKKKKPHSLESRLRMSAARKGKPVPYLHTPEALAKRVAKITGVKRGPRPPEVRARIAFAHIGSKSHSWKGGYANRKERLRCNAFYKTWRASVFQRDRYTCSKCNKKGGHLEADHIITMKSILTPLTSIKDDTEFYRVAWSLPIMRDITNGRTLCKSCHRSVHIQNIA